MYRRLRALVLAAALLLAVLAAVPVYGSAQRPLPPRVAVLTYHDVHPVSDSLYVITPERLEADLRWLLDRGWQPLRLEQFRDWMHGRLELSGDWFLLTFDDGYRDWAEHGYPVLQRLSVPAVNFAITGHLGVTDPRLERPKIAAARLAEIAREGLVTFGSHTHRLHRELDGRPAATVVAPAALAADLDLSRLVLAALTGRAPAAVAWPFGAAPAGQEALVRQRFDLAFLGDEGFARRGEPHAIPRFAMEWRQESHLQQLFRAR